MPLDPQARTMLEMIASMGAPPLSSVPVEVARQMMEGLSGLGDPGVEVDRIEDSFFPGPAGPVPVRLYRHELPPSAPVLVYFHGGGWTLGSLATHDRVCRALAKAAQCLVVSVDYRLAPEARYPAAAEDAFAAVRWVAGNALALGVDPARVAVGGDSAGGNLAAVAALMARDHGGPDLCFQLLVYPVTSRAMDTASYRENAAGYFLTRADMEWFWSNYLPAGIDLKDPYHSPLGAGSHVGLPPALVITAEYDPLRDEGEMYAERLQQAGVRAQLSRYDGMLHGFFGLPLLDQGQRSVEEAARALREAFRG